MYKKFSKEYTMKKIHIFFKLLCILSIFAPTYQSLYSYDQSFTNKVKNSYLNSFGLMPEKKPFPRLYDPNKPLELLKSFVTLSQINNLPLNVKEESELALKASYIDQKNNHPMINERFVDKLALVYGEGNDTTQHLAKRLSTNNDKDFLSTTCGHTRLVTMLTQPTENLDLLKKRQTIIKKLVNDDTLLQNCIKKLEQFKKSEATFLEFFKTTDDTKKELINKVYYSIEALNNSTNLGASTRIGQLSRLVGAGGGLYGAYTISSFLYELVLGNNHQFYELFLQSKYGINKQTAVTIGFLYTPILILASALNISDLKLNNLIITYLQQQLIHVAECVRSCEDLGTLLKIESTFPENLDHLFIRNAQVSYPQEFNDFIDELDTPTFTGQPSAAFSSLGRVLATYKMMEKETIHNQFNLMLNAVGELDVYVALARKIKDCQQKNVHFCFTKFVQKETPFIKGSKIWNVFVPEAQAIANDFIMSKETGQNYIMTGPNKGGKSTFMKTVMYDLLSSFTFGIAAADEFICTPFTLLLAHLNEGDVTSEGLSHFQAQCKRAKELLEKVRSLGKNEFAFALLDEMFTGTSFDQEGPATREFGQALSDTNCAFILATHHPMVTELEEKTAKNCINMHMGATTDANGQVLKYTYNLERGISKVKNAANVARDEGLVW